MVEASLDPVVLPVSHVVAPASSDCKATRFLFVLNSREVGAFVNSNVASQQVKKTKKNGKSLIVFYKTKMVLGSQVDSSTFE